MKSQTILHLALLVGSWSLVNSKGNQANSNSTKGIIRHQQTFDSKLNHLVVDNIAGRVSYTFLAARLLMPMVFYASRVQESKCHEGLICEVSLVHSVELEGEVKSKIPCCFPLSGRG